MPFKVKDLMITVLHSEGQGMVLRMDSGPYCCPSAQSQYCCPSVYSQYCCPGVYSQYGIAEAALENYHRQLRIIKDHLKSALAEVEARENASDRQPQSHNEIERTETQLTEALTALKERKGKLVRADKRTKAAIQVLPRSKGRSK